jgi:hypothetical protein
MGTIYTRKASGESSLSVNSINIVEVSRQQDFGTPSGGVYTLAANTTYVIRGTVNVTNLIAITNTGVAILGLDREKDGLAYVGSAGAGDFITITDVNCEIANIKLSSTNNTAGDVVLNATNFNYGTFNDGRNKILTITNCQFKDCFDTIFIEGFDLIDISNTLFWYIKATTIGTQFKNVSKLQLLSCEYVRWFDETTIPTPSGWATASMIELLPNGAGNGFGAVNINGGIYHPQQTQNGIDIDTSSTTGFGTISSNAFVNVGLTTGKVFLPEIPVILLPDYSQTATFKYDVFANQGIINSTSGVVGTLSGNVTATNTAAGIQDVNTGATAQQQAAVRFTVDTAGIATYNGTKQIYCSIHASVTIDSTGNDGTYQLSLWKDSGLGYVLLSGSEAEVQFDSTGGFSLDVGSVAINYGTLFNNADEVVIRIEKVAGTASDCTVRDFQLVVRE